MLKGLLYAAILLSRDGILTDDLNDQSLEVVLESWV